MVELIDGRYSFGGTAISKGGQAQVFKGFDHTTSQPVAVKVFDLGDRAIDDVHLASWKLELKAYKSLPKHSHLTEILAFGRLESGVPYLVLEWLEEDLLAALDKLQLGGWDDFWPAARDILTGLSVLHREGFIHRDLKLRNILVTQEQRFKIADFGTVRLRPEFDFLSTFAYYGSAPYSAPEFGTSKPTPAYDIYSFAVIAVVCLSGQDPKTPSEVLDSLGSLDLPAHVESVLRACLSVDPISRPQSASILLQQLSQVQQDRASQVKEKARLFFDVLPAALTFLGHLTGDESPSVNDVMEDLRQGAWFEIDRSPDHRGDVRIAGRTKIYSAIPARDRPWQLLIKAVQLPFQRHLDEAQQTWWKPNISWAQTRPMDTQATTRALASFIAKLQEYEATKLAARGGKDSSLFAQLDRVLKAKSSLATQAARSVKYRGARRQGRRIYLETEQDFQYIPNESRLIRSALGSKIFADVESSRNKELVLYVTRGDVRDLPVDGVLEVDSEMSRSKLRREADALASVKNSTSSRADLGELLLAPQHARVATGDPSSIIFRNDHLDQDKQNAVAKSIGLKDILVVDGPPGTGKTTFLAELIGQELRLNKGKILLAAQTHTALDNALSRVQVAVPEARFLRIGSAARIEAGIEPWSVPAQMTAWRQETEIVGRAFVDRLSRELGLSEASAELEVLGAALQTARERFKRLEVQLENAQSELSNARRVARERDLLSKRVLEALDSADRHAQSTSDSDLRAAVDAIVDRGLRLAESIEAGGGSRVDMLRLEALIETTSAELDDLNRLIDQSRVELHQLLPELQGLPDDELVEHTIAGATEERKRVSNANVILEDWTARMEGERTLQAVLLARADVVASTCVALTGVPGATEVPFDLCLIDEASKASSTELLVPMANSKRWVLVGDDRQLPPFLEPELQDDSWLSRFELRRDDLARGLFTDLAEKLPAENHVTLREQHRMHPAIGNLISRVFYGGVLKSADRSNDPLVIARYGAQVTWLDTKTFKDRGERQVGTSMANRFEVRTIVAELKKLNKLAELSKQDRRDVAILAGYDAQVNLLADAIALHRATLKQLEITVATIDSFQGQEADITFFSVTRSNDSGDIGFLYSAPRLNVALSRAKHGLVIVGDSTMTTRSGRGESALSQVWKYIQSESNCNVEAVRHG